MFIANKASRLLLLHSPFIEYKTYLNKYNIKKWSTAGNKNDAILVMIYIGTWNILVMQIDYWTKERANYKYTVNTTQDNIGK